jgi:SSS family solute:Na+ symporter
MGVAVYFYVQRKRSRNENEASSYFLGNRELSWWVIGASLFASNIGSEHLIGLAGAGASGEFAAGQIEILAALILLLLGWFFVPFYLRSGVYTMPEFLERRYDTWSRQYLSWVSVVGYVLTKISVTIAAGAIVFNTLLGIDFWSGAILIVVITGLYTIFGGLKVVVYTDFVQMIILVLGSVFLLYFGFKALGGWREMTQAISASELSLWKPHNDSQFPWTGILLGAPILGVWYWCTDQFIVQRVLAGKSIDESRRGSIFGGFLKLLPLFLFVLPGVIALALSRQPDAILQFPPGENGEPNYDAALPLLTMSLLPVGIKGLVIAGLLAALMSSLSSVFNSCSTLITMDIYRPYFPNASHKKLVQVGQMATVVLVILGLLWIPLMQYIEGGLFKKLQSIQAYIAPPIAAVFLFGVLSRKVTAKAAKWSLLCGAFIGLFRLVLEINKSSLSGIWLGFADINFLHFAFGLFVMCTVVLFLLSAKGRPIQLTADQIQITWNQKLQFQGLKSGNALLSIVLIISVLILWIMFR